MISIKKQIVSAQEMAMPLPSPLAVELYEKAFTDPDLCPSPETLISAYAEAVGSNKFAESIEMRRFVYRTYRKIYAYVIQPLQVNMWPLRNNVDALETYVLDNPIYYGDWGKRAPENSSDPIRQSLQNLKDWIYYWTNDLYALMRPELLRQVNELKAILDRSVKAQRRTTPRSTIATAGPAIKTPDVLLEQQDIGGEEVWKVQTTVYIRGGLSKHVFADYFDTEAQARRSPLMVEAKTLTPEQYLSKFVEYELVQD